MKRKTTPHMYVIDPNGTLIYQGAIDDKPSSDQADIPKAKNLSLPHSRMHLPASL